MTPRHRCQSSTLALAEEAERIGTELRRIAGTASPIAMLERAEAACASLRAMLPEARMAFRGEIKMARERERDDAKPATAAACPFAEATAMRGMVR